MSVLGNTERADQSRSAFVFASHNFPAIGIYDKQKSLNTVSVIEHSDLHALVYCLLTRANSSGNCWWVSLRYSENHPANLSNPNEAINKQWGLWSSSVSTIWWNRGVKGWKVSLNMGHFIPETDTNYGLGHGRCTPSIVSLRWPSKASLNFKRRGKLPCPSLGTPQQQNKITPALTGLNMALSHRDTVCW